MNEPTENPAEDPHLRQREEDPLEEAGSARPGWHARLREKLKARVVVFLDAIIASLVRLKMRAGGQEEKREERVGSKLATEPKKVVEAVVPPSRLRQILICVMLMLVTAIVAMTFAYSLLSKVLSDQSEKIRNKMEEISAYNLENQEKATRIAELMKELDRQRAKLSEANNRLQESPEKESAPVSKAAKQDAPKSAAARTSQPSQTATFKPSAPAKTGNCELTVGGDSADALKRCLDNYNR